MRRIGQVSHISHRGSIILRTEKTPPIGVEVVDKKVQKIGKVLDVFGPVNEPYVSIKPYEKVKTKKLLGQPLYLYRKRGRRKR